MTPVSEETTHSVLTQITDVKGPNQYGWYTVFTNNGKFDTKLEKIVTSARQSIGTQRMVDYSERQKGEYTNRYINSVRVPAADEVGPQPIGQEAIGFVAGGEERAYTPTDAGKAAMNGREKDVHISRQTSWKVVSEMAQTLFAISRKESVSDEASAQQTLQRWAHFIESDINR